MKLLNTLNEKINLIIKMVKKGGGGGGGVWGVGDERGWRMGWGGWFRR